MAFYRAVNLLGPAGEQLQGWIAESFALQGNNVAIAEDDLGRAWTVGEVGPQLLPPGRIQADIRFEVLAPKSCPDAIKTRPAGKPKADKAPKSKKERVLAAVAE